MADEYQEQCEGCGHWFNEEDLRATDLEKTTDKYCSTCAPADALPAGMTQANHICECSGCGLVSDVMPGAACPECGGHFEVENLVEIPEPEFESEDFSCSN